MHRYAILCLFLTGCWTSNYDKLRVRVMELEDKVDRLEQSGKLKADYDGGVRERKKRKAKMD